MDANRMPGDAEAAAAAAGMQDVHGWEIPKVGERIAFRLRSHLPSEYENGRVVRHLTDDGRPIIVIEPEDEPGTMRAIDARLWPTGNLLPY